MVFTFLLYPEPCKIPTMKIIKILINIASISLVFGEDISVEKILLNTFHRMDSVNYQFFVNIKEMGKNEKIKNYQISIRWPENGDIMKETRVKPIQDKKRKPSSIWEHQFKSGQKPKRWMSMPITGKLKDISDKKSTNEFTLADLEFTEKDIAENEHSILSSEKIGDYEDAATTALRENEGIAWDYDNTDFYTRAEILLRYSKFTVFAGEESVGYFPLDTVRDKDGNAAALACAELFAYLELTKSSPLEYLVYLYLKYGYFEEQTVNLSFEGVKGSEIIKKIIDSYSKNEPTKSNDIIVNKVRNFGKAGYLDEDGKPIPVENFFIFELEDAFSIAFLISASFAFVSNGNLTSTPPSNIFEILL